jgi:SPP1 gp7 family putative phage head morphogenesis protein
MKTIELKPIKESPEDYDAIEREIRLLFRREIYIPLMQMLGVKSNRLTNSIDDLVEAIQSGRITFYRGRFTGRFNATLSRELRRIGAAWDRKHGAYAVPHSKLPVDIKQAIAVSEQRFQQTADRINKKIQQILPEEIAGKLKIENLFDKILWKTEKKFEASIKNITIAPTVTPEQRARIAKEYTANLQLYIQDFVKEETAELRKRIEKRAFAGQRYEGVIQEIQKSYGVSQNKAKFLASQETSLLMAKYKQTRYEDAGSNKYRWGCVAGSPAHPVRPMHLRLKGQIFSWKNPPVVNEKGDCKNPGQDFGPCRCFPIAIVRF